jgi:hypothetical protein
MLLATIVKTVSRTTTLLIKFVMADLAPCFLDLHSWVRTHANYNDAAVAVHPNTLLASHNGKWEHLHMKACDANYDL